MKVAQSWRRGGGVNMGVGWEWVGTHEDEGNERDDSASFTGASDSDGADSSAETS
jgi:hypothetical protein